jgi:hypothetical protein
MVPDEYYRPRGAQGPAKMIESEKLMPMINL